MEKEGWSGRINTLTSSSCFLTKPSQSIEMLSIEISLARLRSVEKREDIFVWLVTEGERVGK